MRKIFFLMLALMFLSYPVLAAFIDQTDFSGAFLKSNIKTTSGCTWYNATFTQNGTFVVPAGVTEVFVDMCAGGGGGRSNGGVYNGGQGGDFIWNYRVLVTPGEEISITIGAGGTADHNGDASSFGEYISVDGGEGGYTTGGGPWGGEWGDVDEDGGDGGPCDLASGSLSEFTAVFHGSSGGGGTHVYGGLTPGKGGNSLSYEGGVAGADGHSGGGGAGLFGTGNQGNVDPVANTGAGGGGQKAGSSGKCVIRWCR